MSLVVSALPPLTLISSLFQFSFLLFPPVCRVLFIWKLLRRSELSELAQRHKQPPPSWRFYEGIHHSHLSLSSFPIFFCPIFSIFSLQFFQFFMPPPSWRFYEGIHHSHLSLSSFPNFLSNFSNFFPNFSNFLAPLSWRFYEGIHHSHLSLYNLASSFPFIYLLSPKFSSEFLLFSALIWDDGISGSLFE